MGSIVEKERLVRNVVQLRRAEQECSGHADITAVRLDLERSIGPTVSRSMAARLLGVSQTALDRWIASGDISVVISRAGRPEVPLHLLVELVEAVDDREGAARARYPLAQVMRECRSDTQPAALGAFVSDTEMLGASRGHHGADLRGLAYHRAVASRLDEGLVRKAGNQLERWRAQGRIDLRYASGWEEVLSQPLGEIARLISQDTQWMRDLRQSSPFAGALSESDRRAVLEPLSKMSL